MSENKKAIFFALLAACLYAINVPVSKILEENISATMLAGLLYLGAGTGVGILLLIKQKHKGNQQVEETEEWLTKEDLPYTIAMVVLDIIAPILLMNGIANTTSANASLLSTFEVVATAIIALIFFREKISGKLWLSIILVTIASAILSFEGEGSFVFNKGSLLVLGACVCWGIENNCTRSISDKSSEEIVLIKGIFSGLGSIIIALLTGESFPGFIYIAEAMVLGFVAYGLSIDFYIRAQKDLGAAKTSAFYSAAPFIGVFFSFIILAERPALQFYVAFVIMIISTLITAKESLGNEKLYNGYTHTHQHRHGDIVHTHQHRHYVFNPLHIHSHSHNDL